MLSFPFFCQKVDYACVADEKVKKMNVVAETFISAGQIGKSSFSRWPSDAFPASDGY